MIWSYCLSCLSSGLVIRRFWLNRHWVGKRLALYNTLGLLPLLLIVHLPSPVLLGPGSRREYVWVLNRKIENWFFTYLASECVSCLGSGFVFNWSEVRLGLPNLLLLKLSQSSHFLNVLRSVKATLFVWKLVAIISINSSASSFKASRFHLNSSVL